MAKRGFTLVELIITIGVMAILAAGTMSLIGPGAARSGRDSRRQADLQSISSALAMYRNDEGRYPTCASGNSCSFALSSFTSAVQGVLGEYFNTVPVDPRPNRIYRYTPLTSSGGACSGATRCSRFTLCAGSEKDPTLNINAQCGNLACGSFPCAVIVEN